MNNTISVYMQVYSNKRAVYECLYSFRRYYPDEPITLVCDGGEDFSSIADEFNCTYRYCQENILPHGRMRGLAAVNEYLTRIKEHCVSTFSDWVVLLEEDVQTLRRIKYFPEADCAGTRMNPYSPALTALLTKQFGPGVYGYGMCGGSIFRRESFLHAYGRDLTPYVHFDDRIAGWGDIPLTLIFHLAGLRYQVWSEVSERNHPRDPIVRDSAFDHAFKYWYSIPYEVSV